MSTTVISSYPNKIVALPTSPGTLSWRVVGINPSTRALSFYASLAALKAAGDLTYPGLDGGGKIGNCLIGTKTTAGADGSGVEYRLNSATAPTGMATATNAVSGSGQQISVACPFRNIWVGMLSNTDLLVLDGSH